MEEDRVYPPPQFIVPLRDVNQMEGGKVHFEARIEPVGDPSMKVEWFLNGNVIVASEFNKNFILNSKSHISKISQFQVPEQIALSNLDLFHLI